MSCECEVVKRAKRLAGERGLDPDRVSCPFECDSLNCPYGDRSNISDELDIFQQTRLDVYEGERKLDRFYGKITRSLQLMRGGS